MKSSFRIVLMGDCSKRTVVFNSKVLHNLLSNIKKLFPQPIFIFFLGDMVYGGSNVSEQLDAWKKFVERYYPINMFYILLGNHENNETVFSNAFSHLPKEQLKKYQKTVYSFDYINTRFIILNSNRWGKGGGYAINPEQLTWLESTLESSNRKYNFVMFHLPAFPTGHHYTESLDSSKRERDALWSIIDRYNVTAVFVGHEHNYCRRLIDKSYNTKDLTIKSSIYHITTGGAGSSLNGHIRDIKNVVVGPLALYHYVVLDISDEEVTLHAYDIENTIIDSCSLTSFDNKIKDNSISDVLIPLNSTWKYLDNGSNQGSEWVEPDFDDSKWASGLAELGYGDGGEATIVSYGPNVYKKYITTYFRKYFNVDTPNQYSKLIIRIQRDDGAVVYLNGTEVYRTNMPSGIIDYNTLAIKSLSGDEETSYETVTITSELLREGDNVIAVEIHQASASSSDISFNFQLLGHKNNFKREN